MSSKIPCIAASPYIPSVGPREVDLLHSVRRTVVRCTEYGYVGAPYPQRFLTCPSDRYGRNAPEKGWADNGIFVPDPAMGIVPRYRAVWLKSDSSSVVPGFEIGDPNADFPKRAVLLFRYDAMEIGIDRSSNCAGHPFVFGQNNNGFVCVHTIELDKPFGGLGADDLPCVRGRANQNIGPILDSTVALDLANRAAMYLAGMYAAEVKEK